MKKFRSIPKDLNRWYIVDDTGKPVLLYQKNTIGRWAGLNEYCLYKTKNEELYGKELIVQHGGFLHAVLRCLNGESLTARQMNDIRHALPALEELRKPKTVPFDDMNLECWCGRIYCDHEVKY